jgi:hypothetical protein
MYFNGSFHDRNTNLQGKKAEYADLLQRWAVETRNTTNSQRKIIGKW